MFPPKLALTIGVSAALSAVSVAGLGLQTGIQHVLGGAETTEFKCDLPPVLDPHKDGLPSADELFSSEDALLKQVKRHAAVVQIPSVSYDDNGEPGDDPRWLVFYKLHAKLAQLYPFVHARMTRDTVNTFGLVYSIKGKDESLKPLMLTAHQDVVPVADASTWTYPPFSGYFDGQWLWGRGSSDDKNSLTALFSALETLLSNPFWVPNRSIVLALGFDEECSGRRGAGYIGKYLEEVYGKDSMVLILDEGGMGLESRGDTLYALPAVMEKGHVDIWLELRINGGHSSVPLPHTGIGVLAEIVNEIEANPYTPAITKGSPVYNHFVCESRYSPEIHPQVGKLIEKGDLKALAEELSSIDASTRYRLQTSQAVDYFIGGVKINAMPEYIRVGVNHRIAPQDSIKAVKQNILKRIQPAVEKFGLKVTAFTGEDHNPDVAFDITGADPAKLYNGSLALSSSQPTLVAPISPTSGPTWDVFSGTIQHSFAFNGTVVPVGELMTGNTDTRHYLELTDHVYRWVPRREGWTQNAHTVDEAIDMYGHMEVLKFYYDLIRNFDAYEA